MHTKSKQFDAQGADSGAVLPIFLKIVAVILLCEATIMVCFSMVHLRGVTSVVLNVILLGAMSTPALYRLIVRPIRVALAQQKQAEEALDFERRQLLAIFDSHEEAVYVSDPTTYEVLYANRVATEELGAVVGRKCYETIQGRSRPCSFCTNPFIFAEDVPQPYVWDYRSPINNRVYHCVDRAIQWPDGRLVRYEMAVDITDRIEAEEALREAEQLRVEAEKMAATGRLAARVAHEINNPLAGIKNGFRIVRENVADDNPSQKYIVRIEKEIDRVARIIRQMLGLQRHQRQAPSEVVIEETIRDVAAMLAPVCEQHEVAVEFEFSLPSYIVQVPEDSVRQILYNLLLNGIEASPAGTTVTVRAATSDGSLRLEVCDQGPGIAPDLRKQVFEPFFTTKTHHHDTGGVGLGLSISKALAEAAHGSLDFHCDDGSGCAFRLTLPNAAPVEEYAHGA